MDIKIDIKNLFENKDILVTGGCGSIGSEIVRQLLSYNPKSIRIYDLDETKELDLQMELKDPEKKLRFLIGEIRDKERLKRAVEGIGIIFHAAALKHVPFCESNPFEAIKTNVLGTQNIIDVSLDEEVERIINISTDKAVAPTNTLGATKLLAERLTTAAMYYKGIRRTILASVRFGNVLGSRGSLIPIIINQIKTGSPVTITDDKMTRYFMSIREAVSLVLKASYIATGGEVFILKMPVVRIKDLIEVLIEEIAPKFGHKPDNIKIKKIGIRCGEKLKESLITKEEKKYSTEDEDMYIIKSAEDVNKIKSSHLISKFQKPLTKSQIKEILIKENLI